MSADELASEDPSHTSESSESLTQGIKKSAARVVALARERGVRIASAESMTGGMIGGYLTGVAGASEVYGGGVVSYSENAKTHLLEVSAALLAREGAVSEAVARAMLQGLLSQQCWGEGKGGLLGVAVTGYAGGGKEPRTQEPRTQEPRTQEARTQEATEADRQVFVAGGFAGESGECERYLFGHHFEHHWQTGREAVRLSVTLSALAMLERLLERG